MAGRSSDDGAWAMLEHDLAGVSIEYPAAWRAASNRVGAAILLGEGSGDGFRSTVVITLEPNEGLDLASLIAPQRAALQRLLTDLHTDKPYGTAVDGLPAVGLRGRYRQGIYEVALELLTAVAPDRIVHLCASAEGTRTDEVSPIFERIFKSVRIER